MSRRVKDGEESPRETRRPPAVEIPHDVVNEQVLVAAALVDPEFRERLVARIPADLFVDERHAEVWRGLQDMHRRKLAWSVQSLHQLVAHNGVEIGYLTELARSYPEPPANVDHHVSILHWDHARAESVRGPLSELLRALQDPTTAPERVRALGRSVALSYEVKLGRSFMRDPRVLANSAADGLAERANMAVYPFGIRELDVDEGGKHRLIPGMAPKMITLVTGVSGSGKSVLTARIALEQARMKRRVLYGAWEMGPEMTLELMAMMSLGLSRYDVMTGNVSPEDRGRMRERMEQIGTFVRFFDPPFSGDHSRRYDNDAALDVVHGQVADSGADVAIFDLFERMIPDGDPERERRALWRQQAIAQETHTHCLLVCQQKSKEVEMRADKRPTRSTILGSGAWVDIGDTILGAHRPAQWKAMDDRTMEVDVLKQRYGPWPIAVEFDWDGDRCTLVNGRTIEYTTPSASRGDSELGRFSKGKGQG